MPAITGSRNGRLVAIASRDPDRAGNLATKHRVPRVAADYEAVVSDPDVDAVYIPLTNDVHRKWTLRALAAGKHVLCEKPLAMNAAEAEEMAAAARASGLCLMEAFMYRFHPRTREFVERLRAGAPPSQVEAKFGFTMNHPGDFRLVPELGGGALFDVGCYTVNIARWLLGEPDSVTGEAHIDPETRVDMTASALLHFPGGASASLWCSFESPEEQVLNVVTAKGDLTLPTPFGARFNADDPYLLMVESFGDSVTGDRKVAIPPEDSVANMRVLDRIREAARI
jgi:D-xylose 1-dehydrogenase (NADP+, D-xylono-1,5-lactone-forming)